MTDTMTMPDSQRAPSSAPHLPLRKRMVYGGLCVVLPLLGVAALEGVLRIAGWGGQPPMVKEAARTPEGALMITDPDGARPYFFAGARDQVGSAVSGHFWSPKPAGTLRVFLLGGSAIQGFPQPRHLQVASFLEAMLGDVFPEHAIEVVNFGTTAVSSFPVSDILAQVIRYAPDLVVIYTGHNEFYGAYGMASSRRAGSRPWMQRLQHRARNLALVQAARAALDRTRTGAGQEHHLMEEMIGEARVAPGNWRREAAARTLRHNLADMLRRCRDAGVPAVVCTLPANERDLAPIGDVESAAVQALDEASRDWKSDPARAVTALEALVVSSPGLAHAHYYLGKALAARGDTAAAAAQFVLARDLDPMPWRATTALQQAVRDAAAAEGALLCDVEAFFRQRSEGGIIGWELMDDHVHPSLRGQALVAEAVVRSLTGLDDRLRLEPSALDRLHPFETYAKTLGDNPYDRYGVQRWAVKIFSIPFMTRANPEALQRFAGQVREFEQVQPDYLLATLREWRNTPPICFQVALVLMQHSRNQDALPLLQIAGRAVAPYSSGYLTSTYYELVCAETLQGRLTAEDRGRAGEAITRGELMLRGGFRNDGARERFMGRLHYLRDEYTQAIPYLLQSRAQTSGQNRVADDEALFHCYRRAGQVDQARKLATVGARLGGPFAPAYRQWLLDLASAPPPATPPQAAEK